jgi:aminobenzoyl-glutamate utilization protein B
MPAAISPNVVQAHAPCDSVVRAATAARDAHLLERVRKVAAGAAMMTETQVRDKRAGGVSNLVANGPLCDAMQKVLDRPGPAAVRRSRPRLCRRASRRR